MTSKGLFTADSEKHTIKEVNKAYETGGFALMPFTTKDGDPVYCIPNESKAVGKDYAADTKVTVKKQAAQEVLAVEIEWEEV